MAVGNLSLKKRSISNLSFFKKRSQSFASSCSISNMEKVLGKAGNLEVRLVTSSFELRAAQRLRYQVFYQERSAKGKIMNFSFKRDSDHYDVFCDHLIVVDTSIRQAGLRGSRPKIIGTYRLLRQEMAQKAGGFYTQSEYNLDAVFKTHAHKKFLELGRSCVLKPYRTKKTVELLWHGIWSYVLHHKIDVLFGCASLEGTNIETMRPQLQLLSQFGKAPDDWHARALDEHYVLMETSSVTPFNQKKAFSQLPPLLKGYLRLGAYIGDGAVIDHDFGTTDVLIILPVKNINPRYIHHYGEDAGRYAA